MHKRKEIINMVILFLLGFFLIFLVFTPVFHKNVYLVLSKTSLYNTFSLMEEKHEDEEEEKELVYFEDEFKNQPYANPLPSSIELIQLSLTFAILSFILNKLKQKV